MANVFKSITERAIGTTATKIASYDVPASTTATIIGMTIANVIASAISVTVTKFDGTNHTNIVKDALVPVGSSIIPVGAPQKLVLNIGDSVYVESSDAVSADVILSILEVS